MSHYLSLIYINSKRMVPQNKIREEVKKKKEEEEEEAEGR